MDKHTLFRRAVITILTLCSLNAIAAPSYTQVIQVVNFLANTALPDLGMTPTPVKLEFFNDATTKACWSTTLAYLADFTIRTGTGQSCAAQIHTMKISPIVVSSVLQTYSPALSVSFDLTKYSSQIMILQDTAPVFSTTTGLVSTPGTITTTIQAQLSS